jgi:hypothetical protein
MSLTLDPLDVLLSEPDPRLRAIAHLELGRTAHASDRVQRAAKHFREAALLDPTADAPRIALRELGEVTDPGILRRQRRSVLRRLFRRPR